ncbi:MAG: zf-HC2 domain-containing protein [Pseudonocardiales bacterium]
MNEGQLAAYALDACDHAEAAAVAAHLDGCPSCAAEVAQLRSTAGWLGTAATRHPPAELRDRVMAAALARRPARVSQLGDLLGSWAVQVAALDALLVAAPPERPVTGHGSVRAVVDHLATNDATVAADLGLTLPVLAPAADFRRRWRDGANGVLRAVAAAGPQVLASSVRLAAGGGTGPRRPAAEAFVQRAFETWIHADDVRGALGQPLETPPSDQLARTVQLGLGLLPTALDAAGRGRPGTAVRLVLTGPGGGEHVVPLSAGTAAPGAAIPGTAIPGTAIPGTAAPIIVSTVTAPALVFCRVMANRSGAAPQSVTGDQGAAAALWEVAATLGCE